MGRNARSRSLAAWMNGELVGSWALDSSGAQQFTYDASWLESAAARPISLSMPLRPANESYRGAAVRDFFDNLLPDSKRIRERLQRRFRTESADAFDLLAEIGRDCVGALQLLPHEETPRDVHTIRSHALTESEVERLLSAMLEPTLNQRDDEFEEAFRISIAGAQEKTALLWHQGRWHLPVGATPTTHILKLPIGTANQGIDLSTSVENEWLCAQVVRAFGLRIATVRMEQFGRFKVLVVERFDRRRSEQGSWWLRLPQEDFCQATGTPAALKYESDGGPGIRAITEILLGSAHAPRDRADFMRTQIIFWLLCAIDGHAKNFSIALLPGGAFELTPLYDVLSAHPVLGTRAGQLSPKKVKMAMAVEGKGRHYHWERIQPRHWIETAKRCGMQAQIPGLIEEIVARVPEVIRSVEAAVPKSFPASVLDPVFRGLERGATLLESASAAS
jgi:serine/threonine-protein kinase HipA